MEKTRLENAIAIKSEFDEHCIVHQSLQLLGNKWTLLVLMSLIKETKRTHQLLREISGISTKVLSQTLKKLISYGMVSKKIYPVVPPSVEYSLTEFGKTLIPLLDSLFVWALEHEEQVRKVVKNAE